MSDRKGRNLLTVILGCSMLACGTTVAFAASDTSQATPSDTQITQKVVNKLTREMPDSLIGLQVQTENGVVTLTGRADTGVAKLQAEENARRVPGVTDVKDNLRIQGT